MINMKISALFKTLIVLSLLIVFSAVLYACQPAGYTAPPPVDRTYLGNSVVRYVDEEAGVACWVFEGYKSGGIDCLPISDTLLKR